MDASLIDIIGSAIAAARQVGLDRGEEVAAARAVLMARDPSLSPGVARILVERLYPAIEADMAA
jgi:hypothetical protein